MNDAEFTILMPCLNEEGTIGFCISEALEYIAKSGIRAEILIADNESTDISCTLARAMGARTLTIPEKGYGNALRKGIREARGKYIIMGDCDGSYDFTDLDGFVEKLREGYALVMGNRYLGGFEKGAMPFWHRFIGVPFLSFLGRLKYKTNIGDFHCGLRAFQRDTALSLNLKAEGMEFATEIIGAFAKTGEKICEIPVTLRRDKRSGKSHLRTVRDGLRHIRLILFNE